MKITLKYAFSSDKKADLTISLDGSPNEVDDLRLKIEEIMKKDYDYYEPI